MYPVVPPTLGLAGFRNVVEAAGSHGLRISLDTETTGLDIFSDEITWTSWTTKDGYGAVPVDHSNPRSLNEDWREVAAVIRAILSNPRSAAIFHNAQFDLGILAERGWISIDHIACRLLDTQTMAYLLNPVSKKEKLPLRLKQLYRLYLKEPGDPDQPSFKQTCAGLDFRDVPSDRAAKYAAWDTWTTFHLANRFEAVFDSDPYLKGYLESIEIPHILNTLEIQRTGLALLEPEAGGMPSEHEQSSALRDLEQEIYRRAGRSFNLGSTRDLARCRVPGIRIRYVPSNPAPRRTWRQLVPALGRRVKLRHCDAALEPVALAIEAKDLGLLEEAVNRGCRQHRVREDLTPLADIAV